MEIWRRRSRRLASGKLGPLRIESNASDKEVAGKGHKDEGDNVGHGAGEVAPYLFPADGPRVFTESWSTELGIEVEFQQTEATLHPFEQK